LYEILLVVRGTVNQFALTQKGETDILKFMLVVHLCCRYHFKRRCYNFVLLLHFLVTFHWLIL